MSISDAEYLDWLSHDHERVTLLRADAWTGSAVETLTVADRRWYDAVNGDIYIDRLRDDLEIVEALSMDGEQGESSVGVIGLHNQDGALDDWLQYSFAGHTLQILIGGPDWPFDDFRPLFTGKSERIEAPDDRRLDLHARDNYEPLEAAIVERPLNMHPSALLQPYPLVLGEPQNVSPPLTQVVPPNDDATYILSTWPLDADPGFSGGPAIHAVYENGVTTAKSLARIALVGGGIGGFKFSVNDPEGTVTCDPKASIAGPTWPADPLHTSGEMLEYVLRWQMNRESGICPIAGSTTTVVLDANASDVDDHYNGQSIYVFRRASNQAEVRTVSDYDGASRTATVGTAFSWAVAQDDRYDVVPPSPVQVGPFTTGDYYPDTFADLDTAAPYPLGIWDPSGRLTYRRLLDTILPAAVWHHMTPAGQIRVGLQADPSTDTPVMELGGLELRDEPNIIQHGYPNYRVRVSYDRNNTRMSSPAETVSIERAAFLGRDSLYELDQDLTVLEQFPDARSIDYESYILGRADAQTEAQRIFAIKKKQRYWGMFPARMKPMAAQLHDTITLRDKRYGQHDGTDWRLMRRHCWPCQGRTAVEVWR